MKKSKDKNGKPKKKLVKVNFTDVEVRVLLPEGQYHAKVAEITQEEGNAAPYLKWVFEVIDEDPKKNGKKLFYNTSLAPQALWNLRNLLETLGVNTPDSETELDTDNFLGLELMVRVEHETYEGKDRAKVSDFTPLEEATDVEDDEKKNEAEDEEEEGEEEETEEEEEEEEADEEEEKEEEEEADDKPSREEISALEKDEILELIKTHKLKIADEVMKKPGKRLAAVLDQMEAKGLLATE